MSETVGPGFTRPARIDARDLTVEAVRDGDAPAAQACGELLGDGDGAMSPAGTSDGDGEVAASLGLVLRYEARQQLVEPIDERGPDRGLEDVVAHLVAAQQRLLLVVAHAVAVGIGIDELAEEAVAVGETVRVHALRRLHRLRGLHSERVGRRRVHQPRID
jgi:hypothetical protein